MYLQDPRGARLPQVACVSVAHCLQRGSLKAVSRSPSMLASIKRCQLRKPRRHIAPSEALASTKVAGPSCSPHPQTSTISHRDSLPESSITSSLPAHTHVVAYQDCARPLPELAIRPSLHVRSISSRIWDMQIGWNSQRSVPGKMIYMAYGCVNTTNIWNSSSLVDAGVIIGTSTIAA